MGRPSKELIQKLVIKYRDERTGSLWWACIARKNPPDMCCNHLCSGNAQESRVLAHALKCGKLSEGLKCWVAEQAATSAKLVGTSLAEVGEGKQEKPADDNLPEQSIATGLKASVSFSKGKEASKPLKQPLLDLIVGEEGRKVNQTEYNHVMVLLVAVGGVVPKLFDKPVWKHAVEVLTKNGTHC